MANILRIKRRTTGASGAPATLSNAELAFNEVDNTLYYGKGVGTGGAATSVIAIAGDSIYNNFVTLSGSQTITGAKTFTGGVTLESSLTFGATGANVLGSMKFGAGGTLRLPSQGGEGDGSLFWDSAAKVVKVDGATGVGTTSLVDLNTAQTLTNKTITGSFTGPLTGTASSASSVTNALTAGTGLTMGGTFDGSVARTIAISSDVATLSGSQTFTGNKSFSGSVNVSDNLNFLDTANGTQISGTANFNGFNAALILPSAGKNRDGSIFYSPVGASGGVPATVKFQRTIVGSTGVETVDLVDLNTPQTLTNKTITPGTGAITSSSSVITAQTTTNATFYPVFTSGSSGVQSLSSDPTTLTYNPNTNTLHTGTIRVTSLTTGSSGTAGSIVGTWTVGSGSSLVATSIQNQANSATITAASTNTANQIVLRDGSGGFSAGTITATSFVGPLTGNASTATTADKVANSLNIGAGLGATGPTSYDGSAAVGIFNADRGSSQNIFKNIANAGGTVQFSAGSNTDTIRIGATGAATVSFSAGDKLITISATDTNTTYSAGSGLSLTGTTFAVDNTVVRTSGAQTIGGLKTFTDAVAITSDLSLGDENNTDPTEIYLTVYGSAVFEGGADFGLFPTLPEGEPTLARHAVPKSYVDALAEGLNVHASVVAANSGTSTLQTLTGGTVTYANGASGVGATLTLSGGSANFTSSSVWDSATVVLGNRVLVKNQANAAHNGIYTVTSNTVLTRAVDFDTSAEMRGGDFFFVESGTTYGKTGWVLTEPVTTVGTTNVIFSQFSGAGTYVAGAGLTLTGNTFAHEDTSSVANLNSDNSGNTFIQDINFTFDTYGHVTGATVTAAQVQQTYAGWLIGVNGATGVNIGSGQSISLQSGTGVAIASTTAPSGYDYAYSFSHGNTSAVGAGTYGTTGAEDGSYIRGVTLDSFGHITAIAAGDFDDRYQAISTRLTDIAALATTNNNFIVANGTTWTSKTPSDARTSLGLGTIATQNANNVNITGGTIDNITLDGGTF
jgi:hypothetical protein